MADFVPSTLQNAIYALPVTEKHIVLAEILHSIYLERDRNFIYRDAIIRSDEDDPNIANEFLLSMEQFHDSDIAQYLTGSANQRFQKIVDRFTPIQILWGFYHLARSIPDRLLEVRPYRALAMIGKHIEPFLEGDSTTTGAVTAKRHSSNV